MWSLSSRQRWRRPGVTHAEREHIRRRDARIPQLPPVRLWSMAFAIAFRWSLDPVPSACNVSTRFPNCQQRTAVAAGPSPATFRSVALYAPEFTLTLEAA